MDLELLPYSQSSNHGNEIFQFPNIIDFLLVQIMAFYLNAYLSIVITTITRIIIKHKP